MPFLDRETAEDGRRERAATAPAAGCLRSGVGHEVTEALRGQLASCPTAEQGQALRELVLAQASAVLGYASAMRLMPVIRDGPWLLRRCPFLLRIRSRSSR